MTRKTILIVDDSAFDRNLLAKALSDKSDFQTVAAASGNECLEILSAQKIDLVLMDIMMPGTLGTEVLVKIREKFNQIELPIIMVTAKADAKDVISSLKSGANDFISKPLNFDIALSRISTHLMLADISNEMSRLKKMEALAAMITTYNHEINNPLEIALACLDENQHQTPETMTQIKTALLRIANIVKEIQDVGQDDNSKYAQYSGTSKMIKLK